MIIININNNDNKYITFIYTKYIIYKKYNCLIFFIKIYMINKNKGGNVVHGISVIT